MNLKPFYQPVINNVFPRRSVSPIKRQLVLQAARRRWNGTQCCRTKAAFTVMVEGVPFNNLSIKYDIKKVTVIPCTATMYDRKKLLRFWEETLQDDLFDECMEYQDEVYGEKITRIKKIGYFSVSDTTML